MLATQLSNPGCWYSHLTELRTKYKGTSWAAESTPFSWDHLFCGRDYHWIAILWTLGPLIRARGSRGATRSSLKNMIAALLTVCLQKCIPADRGSREVTHFSIVDAPAPLWYEIHEQKLSMSVFQWKAMSHSQSPWPRTTLSGRLAICLGQPRRSTGSTSQEFIPVFKNRSVYYTLIVSKNHVFGHRYWNRPDVRLHGIGSWTLPEDVSSDISQLHTELTYSSPVPLLSIEKFVVT